VTIIGKYLGTFSRLQMSQETPPAALDRRLPLPALSIGTGPITAVISAVIPRVAVSAVCAITAVITAVIPRVAVSSVSRPGGTRTEHLVRYTGHGPFCYGVTPTRASAKCQHRKDCKNHGGFFDHTLILLSTSHSCYELDPIGDPAKTNPKLGISVTNLEVNEYRKAFPVPFSLLAVFGNAPRDSFFGDLS
jgi:hypothetical protein